MMRFLRRLSRHLRDSRGIINTTDLLVASGATIILAAGVAVASLSGLDQAKLGKAMPDAVAMGQAMTTFFKDTGKWPGQTEVAGSTATGAKTAKFLASAISGTEIALPSFGTATTFSTAAATCEANSLEGFVGASIGAGTQPANSTTFTNFLNINDYLVRKPDSAKYPNWRGPYLQAEITTDPFGRVWVINTLPLFCAEEVTSTTTSAGNLGYAWILTGGANRTVSTTLTATKLDDEGDDAGVNLSKLVKKSSTSGF